MLGPAIPLVVPQPPAQWICLDIETGNAPEDAIENAIAAWKPPGNVKAEDKIESRRQEAAEKIRNRSALLDAAPILCVAVQTDRERLIFNGMDTSAPMIDSWPVLPCGDEQALLLAFRAWLDARTTVETALIGHNARGFDLPKLRSAYVRHSLKLPLLLRPGLHGEAGTEVIDTAGLFRAFSVEHRDDFCPSLTAMAAGLGIVLPKTHISGADVPRLHSEGQYEAILLYCAVDTATTARSYQLMASTAPDLL